MLDVALHKCVLLVRTWCTNDTVPPTHVGALSLDPWSLLAFMSRKEHVQLCVVLTDLGGCVLGEQLPVAVERC